MTGRKQPPTVENVPGRWILKTQDGSVRINSLLLDPGTYFLVPDRRLNWSVALDSKLAGHFDSSVLPDAEDIRALSQISAAIKCCTTLAEYLAVSPIPTDLDVRGKSQLIDTQIVVLGAHLIHACHKPRQQLKTDHEKLPVGRAKRIPPRSLEYLASHSEDWKRKTVHGIEPTHVIAEIIEDQLNIYENRVAAELVDRITNYLRRRIAELEKIQALLTDRFNFQNAFATDAHFRLAQRISELWGANYNDSSISNATRELKNQLIYLNRLIVGLKQSVLYKNVPVKREIKKEIYHTNIFEHDLHYREVAKLWRSWHESDEVKEQDEESAFCSWQKANRDYSIFCRLLFCRTLNDIGWKCETNAWKHTEKQISFNDSYDHEIIFQECEDSTFFLTFDNIKIRIIPLLATLGRLTDFVRLASWIKNLTYDVIDTDTLFLYYGTSSELRDLMQSDSEIGVVLDGLYSRVNNSDNKNVSFLPVSPFEITSLEKVGRYLNSLLRGRLLKSFPAKIKAPLPLGNYLQLGAFAVPISIDTWSLTQPIDDAILKKTENLINKLNLPDVRRKVSVSENAIKQAFSDLENANKLSSSILICPVCGQSGEYKIQESNAYICTCRFCGAEWGLRMCRSCRQIYPYLSAANTQPSKNSIHEPGWVDRNLGRDCISIPCTHPQNLGGRVCSNCFTCTATSLDGICRGCPGMYGHHV